MKIKEILALSDSDLSNKLQQYKEELFNLRFQYSIHQLKNPMRIRHVRKNIARIKTVARQRKEVQ